MFPAPRENGGKSVLISSHNDTTCDAAQNTARAGKRAQALRHAHEPDGVTPDRLVLDQPLVAIGAADAREASRVELRLRAFRPASGGKNDLTL